MPHPDKRGQRYLVDTKDTVDRANLDQKELEAAGDDPKKRVNTRERKYMRDALSAVERANR